MGINTTDSVASTGIHYINLITSFDNVLILQKRYNFVIILPINPASNSDKVFFFKYSTQYNSSLIFSTLKYNDYKNSAHTLNN